MDPENVAMRTRLAEVYIRLNKKTEAWQLFAAAADSLRTRGQLGPAEEILNRMLTLDPSNSQAMLLRGRNAFDSGDMAGTIKNLEKVADLDTHPEGLRALMQAYLQSGRLPEAGTLATKLCTIHNDTSAITGYADALMAVGNYTEVLQVYELYADRLVSTDSTKVIETLHSLIGHMREDIPALESILDLSQKAGDSSHMTEIYELLGHACVHSGNFEKARDYYLKLTQLEPQNQLHTRNYQQVLAKLGGGAPGVRLITAEEGAVLVEELEATAPFLDQRYPDEIALAVRAALTDAELFVSYNMPAKALGPLLSALPKAPRDLRLNQRLAALHTRAGRFSEAAICCRNLEQLYHDAGHPDEATRYKDLADKYEERTSKAVQEIDAEPTSAALFALRLLNTRQHLIALQTTMTLPRSLQLLSLRPPDSSFTKRRPPPPSRSPPNLKSIRNQPQLQVKSTFRRNGRARSRMNPPRPLRSNRPKHQTPKPSPRQSKSSASTWRTPCLNRPAWSSPSWKS